MLATDDAHGGPTSARTTGLERDSERVDETSVSASVGAERARGVEHEVDVRGVDGGGDIAGRMTRPRVLQETRQHVDLGLDKRQHIGETTRLAGVSARLLHRHWHARQALEACVEERRVTRIATQMGEVEFALQKLRRESILSTRSVRRTESAHESIEETNCMGNHVDGVVVALMMCCKLLLQVQSTLHLYGLK
jgi:hypothetical protein